MFDQAGEAKVLKASNVCFQPSNCGYPQSMTAQRGMKTQFLETFKTQLYQRS